MRARPFGVRDWAIAVGTAAILVVTGLSVQRPTSNLNPLGYALLAAAGLALVAHRRAPVAVLAVTGLCTVGYQALGFDVAAVAFVVAVYAGMRAGHRIATVAASAVMLGALPLAAFAAGLHGGAAFDQARGALGIAWLL